LALNNPTLPEITDGYKTQLHHEPGHDPHCQMASFKIAGDVALPTATHDKIGSPDHNVVITRIL
jgi:hypothetical protein